MKIIGYSTLAFLFAITVSSCRSDDKQLNLIKVPELEKIINNREDRLYVINFWATWCAPCVQELPYFEKISAEYDQEKVKIILINLDFPSQAEKILEPFLKKNDITLPVSVMMETDANLWIEKVDSLWQGEIPATLFINNAKKIRKFNPGILDYQQIKETITELL